ncbi:MAG: branched-chain amino acid ABC transporter permease [Deltaproteobacteria bacterium]|nr:branched-chain amino acid ABC transporter permease [Deltaproteobacteria bacterium]
MARYATLLLVGVILALVPLTTGGSPYYSRITTLMLVLMVYAVAFNMLFGHTKQLFLCLGALAGSSAYLSVVLTRELGLSPWATIPLGILVAGLLGGLFSYVSVRRGLGVIFLGVVTLAFSLIFYNLVLGLRELTNGETGIVTQGLGAGILEGPRSSYYMLFALLMIALVLYSALMSSRVGVAFRALSDDELTAELAGIDVTRYKVIAATVGSLLMGAGGAFYAYYTGLISPALFSLISVDIVVLITLVFGGMGSLVGPVLGGAAVTVIDELVRPFGQLNVLVYGALLIVLFLAFRGGLVAVLRKTAKLPIP